MKTFLRSQKFIVLAALCGACAVGAQTNAVADRGSEFDLIRYEFATGELDQLCTKAIEDTKTKLDDLASRRNITKDISTLLEFETILADFTDVTSPLIFMAYVSTNDKIREEGSNCEEKVGQFTVSIFTRKDLYDQLTGIPAKTPEDQRLLSETLKSFERNGLKLSEENLNQLRELKKHLTSLESKFAENLNNDTSTVSFTAEELTGVTQDFLTRLKKSDDGLFLVTTKSTDYLHVMENAKNSETRRRMSLAYNNRAAQENPKLLEEAILLRQKIAKLMGFKTWADYRTDGRMAQSANQVSKFLANLRTKLATRNKADLQKLLKFKKSIDPGATKLESWDLGYMAYQLKKRDYSLDDEKIREYFPTDYVMKGVFDVYSEILGVTYERIEDAKVWSPDVQLYKVLDRETKKLIAFFYADFVPRKGKYGHAAAFPLISGRARGAEYSYPVASIVANFNPPANGKPSLLNVEEVETLFHEFGHIMHQILTRAPYASLAGTNVAQDFVEAPSQMLENWVWSPAILNRISGHYKNNEQKLSPELLKQILAAKDFNQGYFYTRQLFLGLMDLTMHTTAGRVDTTKLHDTLMKTILGIDPIAGGHFNGTFGHLMGGYDAGYYGYLWSEVYAQDMFTRFEKEGLLNPKTGADYRRLILESGNMQEALALVRAFLGREPNPQAFYKKLGIK